MPQLNPSSSFAGVQSPPHRETGTRTRGTSGFKGEMHR